MALALSAVATGIDSFSASVDELGAGVGRGHAAAGDDDRDVRRRLSRSSAALTVSSSAAGPEGRNLGKLRVHRDRQIVCDIDDRAAVNALQVEMGRAGRAGSG